MKDKKQVQAGAENVNQSNRHFHSSGTGIYSSF